jgi:hypothetical protein
MCPRTTRVVPSSVTGILYLVCAPVSLSSSQWHGKTASGASSLSFILSELQSHDSDSNSAQLTPR